MKTQDNSLFPDWILSYFFSLWFNSHVIPALPSLSSSRFLRGTWSLAWSTSTAAAASPCRRHCGGFWSRNFRRCHRDGVSWGKHGLFGVGLCGMPGTPSTRDCPGLNTDIEPRKQIGNGFVLDICSCFRGCMLGFWASVDWMHCWTWKTFTLNGTVNGISMDLNREISSNGIFQWYTNG